MKGKTSFAPTTLRQPCGFGDSTENQTVPHFGGTKSLSVTLSVKRTVTKEVLGDGKHVQCWCVPG